MDALILVGNGEVAFKDVPTPEIGDFDILLEVKACGICGSDLHKYYGHLPTPPKHPFIMGHEFAGVVVKKGKYVSDLWQLGDRVLTDNTGAACGVCPSCQSGHYANCPERVSLGSRNDGGFAKYVKIPGDILRLNPTGLMKIPEDIPFAEATVLYGTEGVMHIYENPEFSIVLEKKTGERILYAVDQIQTNDCQTKSGVIDLWVDCLANQTPPEISGEEAIHAMKAVFAAVESAESGKRIVL